MKRLILAALLAALALPAPALAQQALVVAVCAANTYEIGSYAPLTMDSNGRLCSGSPAPSGSTAVGITPVVSAAAENARVLKSSAGNLYSIYATNLTATAGFLLVFNATAAPADGAVAPLACVPLPGGGVASLNNKSGPPQIYSTGIVAVVSSATTCFTKTTGTITAFISGDVQ